jgi:nicotinate-nucleotide adenylyltransferase
LSEYGGILKVGILGGTFNPPHLGHLRLAEEVAYDHELHRIIFIPSFTPPHKDTSEIIPADHRLEMTHRACEGNDLFEVSDMEIALKGPSYTVDTLRSISNRSEDEIFFIMGTDSLKEIRAWKDCEKLFELSHFIVVRRPQTDFETAWSEVPREARARFTWQRDHYLHSASTMLIPAKVWGLDISSTRIRSLLKEGRSIRYLVPESVRLYIMENDLYG